MKNVHRLLRLFYDRHNWPGESKIRAVITNFRTKFTLLDIKLSTHMRKERIKKNITVVGTSVDEDREI